jgi:hypothetical protein
MDMAGIIAGRVGEVTGVEGESLELELEFEGEGLRERGGS